MGREGLALSKVSLTSTETIRLIREKGRKGLWRWGRGRLYTYRCTVTTRMTCIKMASDESHFNVSLIVRDKVTRQCPQITTFEEKGEPKQIQTEVPLLTSLTARPKRLALRCWLKCCFTSTETVGLLGTGAQDVHLDFHTPPELSFPP